MICRQFSHTVTVFDSWEISKITDHGLGTSAIDGRTPYCTAFFFNVVTDRKPGF
jgi:hypothetical protein